ncbi:MAG TPA: patatin-like phospholipase family protein [Magnetospirillaceae bacterium]|jgi:NTE family protein
MAAPPKQPTQKTINLALQGGGSHGAFTWGVLDRLLDEERLIIEGISGTSAGAMNAAVLAQGLARNGRIGAKAALDTFWRRVSALSLFSPVRRTLLDVVTGNWNLDRSPTTMVLDAVQNLFSPYQTNPLDVNPLRDLLAEMVNEKDIQSSAHVKLFICATNVQTGKPRVFDRHELTVDAVMASASLPFTFQATMIDGVPYWDGGYMGNPVIWPLIYYCTCPDVALVQINPLIRLETPKTPVEIVNRVNEIGFNSSLIAEMRAIAFVQKLLTDKLVKPGVEKDLKLMHMHLIEDEGEMRTLGAASKANAELDFLLFLRDLGQRTADKWLAANWDHIGVRTSFDLRAKFLE